MGPLFWLPTRGRGSQVSGGGGPNYDPAAADYFSRIATNGGTISTPDKSAFNAFIVTLKNGGQWDKLIELGRFGGNQLAAALVKVKDPGTGPLTNHNFVDADFSPVMGLKGDGSTKSLDTNTTPSDFGATWNNQSFGVFATNTTSSSDISQGVSLGGGSTYLAFGGEINTTVGNNSSLPRNEGLYCFQCNGTSLDFYWQGAEITVSQAPTGTAGPTSPMSLFQYSGSFFQGATISAYFIGKALTSSDAQALSDALETLMGNLNSSRRNNVFAAFGDSITFGLLADPGMSYPDIVAADLSMTLSRQGISGTTMEGIGGFTSGRGSCISRLASQSPSKVVVAYGVNDVISLSDLTLFGQQYQTTLQKIKRICSLPGTDITVAAVWYLNNTTNPNATPTNMLAYTAAAQNAATAEGCKFVNLYQLGLNNGGDSLDLDGTHPGDPGHALIGGAIANGLPQITQVDFNGLTGANFVTAGEGKAWIMDTIAQSNVYVWYNTGTETQPSGDHNFVEVDISAVATASAIAAATVSALITAYPSAATFAQVNGGGTNTACQITDAANAPFSGTADVNAGVTVTVTQTGATPL